MEAFRFGHDSSNQTGFIGRRRTSAIFLAADFFLFENLLTDVRDGRCSNTGLGLEFSHMGLKLPPVIKTLLL